MRKIIIATLATLTLSFSVFADDVDSLSTQNDINNQSNQNSTGIVSNQPTFINNGNNHAYGTIGRASCAQASLNVGVAGSGSQYTNDGSVYLNLNIPLTMFGSGKSCAEAMHEATVQMKMDTNMVLTDHCTDLLAKGYNYSAGNEFSKKCQGFELTGVGQEIVAARRANLIADQQFAAAKTREAQNAELRAELDRINICQAYAEKGVMIALCRGVPLPVSFSQ
tara:strand:+ start:45308 stop:45976 length:669 start_codon:yes stop_codon:yes gene_type:complete